MIKPLLLSASILFSGLPAHANPPKIVTDIAPVHSLVKMITQNKAEIEILIDGSSSPHDFALKPSQAKALQDAQLVFYIATDLTPWLAKPLSTLADGAHKTSLLNVDGTTILQFRESVDFSDDHDHGHHHTVDPHAWLSIDNAIIWLDTIAQEMAAYDPENASFYQMNAKQAKVRLTKTSETIKTILAPYPDAPIILFHDAFQYFEKQYGLNARGAFTLADGAKPSPKQIKQIQRVLNDNDVHCIFVEPQMNTSILKAVNAPNIKQATLDPLDSTIPLGANFYPQLMEKTAETIRDCVKP